MPDKPIVQLFITCLMDTFFPDAGEAVLDVLESQGVQVEFPPDQTCCGQPAYNAGFREEARATAVRFLDVFDAALEQAPAAAAPIVCPSGSCTAMIKHGYLDLFKDDPDHLERARALAARTYEFSEYLVDVMGVTGPDSSFGGTLTYHPSCHLLRGLEIDRQPRQLLGGLRGVTLIELPEATECCGFGGLFAIKHGDVSGEILAKKLAAIRKTGAHTVVGCDMSCLMHIQGGLRRSGDAVRCLHIAEVLQGARRKERGLRK